MPLVGWKGRPLLHLSWYPLITQPRVEGRVVEFVSATERANGFGKREIRDVQVGLGAMGLSNSVDFSVELVVRNVRSSIRQFSCLLSSTTAQSSALRFLFRAVCPSNEPESHRLLLVTLPNRPRCTPLCRCRAPVRPHISRRLHNPVHAWHPEPSAGSPRHKASAHAPSSDHVPSGTKWARGQLGGGVISNCSRGGSFSGGVNSYGTPSASPTSRPHSAPWS